MKMSRFGQSLLFTNKELGLVLVSKICGKWLLFSVFVLVVIDYGSAFFAVVEV